MIAPTLLLLGAALAAPAYNLPSASSLGPHALELGVGPGLMLRPYGPLPAARGSLRADLGSWGLNASSTAYVGQATERFDLLGLSWRALEGDRLSLAPAVMLAHHSGEAPLDRRVTGRIGLALDTGGPRWRFDATLGLVGAQWFPAEGVERPLARLSTFDAVLASELGLRWQSGDHMLRAGLLGVMPCLRWGWSLDRWLVGATAGTLGDQHLLQLELGLGLPGLERR
jgi:hypothetical protein